MNLRHLRYFVALAREKNHARAAAACNVTQPTLSEAVRQLEHELAVPLIDRSGPRYGGLTAEGERALLWAQRILADGESLEQELSEMRSRLSGDLRFGIIPAAMPIVPMLTNPFAKANPQVTLKLVLSTSIEIQRGLDEGVLDAGLTYLDNEPLRGVRMLPLYRERYMLLTPAGGAFDGRRTVTWKEAAALPLCLLSREMQNRRIVDRLFAEGGAEKPKVAIETNSVLALVAHVRSGQWSSVIPQTFLGIVGGADEGLNAVALISPEAAQTVGLVLQERDPLPPLARALLKSARQVDLSAMFDTPMRKAS